MLRFKYASVPLVLRADQKDETYIRRLTDGIQSIAALAKGSRFVSTYESALATTAEALYYYATLVVTGQTLGDEYVDLLPLTASGRPIRWVVLHAIVRVLVPMLLRRLVGYWMPSVPTSTSVHHVNMVHTAIFFIFGSYHTLANRLLRSRAISMSPEGQSSNSGMYPVLGFIMLLQEAIVGYQWWKAHRAEASSGRGTAADSAAGRSITSDAAAVSDAESSEGDGVETGRCSLCLCDRRQPAATRCGHIFCWDCIMRWFETSSNGAPICPNCRQPCAPQSVVRLVNYAVTTTTTTAAPIAAAAVGAPASS